MRGFARDPKKLDEYIQRAATVNVTSMFDFQLITFAIHLIFEPQYQL